MSCNERHSGIPELAVAVFPPQRRARINEDLSKTQRWGIAPIETHSRFGELDSKSAGDRPLQCDAQDTVQALQRGPCRDANSALDVRSVVQDHDEFVDRMGRVGHTLKITLRTNPYKALIYNHLRRNPQRRFG